MPFHKRFVTGDGASISAALVVVSATAAIIRDFFIALVPRLVPCTSDPVGNGRKLFATLRSLLLRSAGRTAACRLAVSSLNWLSGPQMPAHRGTRPGLQSGRRDT